MRLQILLRQGLESDSPRFFQALRLTLRYALFIASGQRIPIDSQQPSRICSSITRLSERHVGTWAQAHVAAFTMQLIAEQPTSRSVLGNLQIQPLSIACSSWDSCPN